MNQTITRIAAFIATCAFALAGAHQTANATEAAPAAAPITMQGCSVDGKWQTYDVNFTNAASQEVTKIRFAMMDASGALAMVDDVGSYAPGGEVHHRLRVDEILLRIYSDIQCVPASVTFKDGTTWQNQAVPSDMELALPQTPGSQIAISRCFVGDGVEMHWKNTAQQDATKVDLGLIQHGLMVWRISDTGDFSPGTLIQRSYDDGAKGYVVGDDLMQNRCIVLGVHYEDGTVWTNPSVPALSEKGIPFTAPADPDPNAPVTITGCDGSSFSDWRVTYQNSSSKPIVAADFALIMHDRIDAAARDLHNLGPGDGNFARFSLDGDDNVYHPACMPLRVKFADGTSWVNPVWSKK